MKRLPVISVVLSLLVTLSVVMSEAHADTEPFVHPGLLHAQEDFDRMKEMVNAGVQPYLDGYYKLRYSPYASYNWNPRATKTISRGGRSNIALLFVDTTRAYQNALRWKIDGNKKNGDKARDILNAWSSTLKEVTGNADRYLAAGLNGYQLANAAELMRGYPGFDVGRMQDMLLKVFYKPLTERFLYGNEYGSDHNGAHIQNYWANWDLANMAAAVAIGIFCDRRDIYERAIEYFKHGAGNGSIYNAVPFLHADGLAQWQESGRDQPHTQLGIGLMAATAEMAWHQGDDLYGWANNRFMRAAEYVAKFNNEESVPPFSMYEWQSGVKGSNKSQWSISYSGRGGARPVWEMIYNHYANRMGMSVPNIAARAKRLRPEGGPNNSHPSTFDQPGLGTLLYTRSHGSGKTAKLAEGNIPNGIYRFRVKRNGKVMSAEGTKNNAAVVQQEDEGLSSQQWRVTHLGGGQYSVINVKSGRALDVAKASHGDGAGFQLWSYYGGDNQRFAFIPAGRGFHRFTPVHSNKPADVAHESTVVQWRYLRSSAQHWRIEPVSVNVLLRSHNYPDHYIRHTDSGVRIETDVSKAGDSAFKMVSGLADARGVSFESTSQPGRYLRAQSNGEVLLEANDGTEAFADDATFSRVAGLADDQKSSYRMWTDSSRYLRHANFILYAQSGSGALFEADSTFAELTP